MKENHRKTALERGRGGTKKKKASEDRPLPDSGLQVIAIDENAIDDDHLIKKFKELCKQQNPGSVHYELKLVKEEVNDNALVIEQLQKKIKDQAKELKLLRGTSGFRMSGGTTTNWGKIKNAVFGTNVKQFAKSSKPSSRKRKKFVKKRRKKK